MFWFKPKEIPVSQYRNGGRKDRVLQFFQERKGEKVSLPTILYVFRDISDPTRTIRYLCADGYLIENEMERHNKIVHSFYTFKGIDNFYPKKRAKHYTIQDMDKSYEAGYQACKITNNIK